MREYLTLMGLMFFSLLLLRRKRYFLAAGVYLFGIFSAIYHGSISWYLKNLGVDSFAESQDFSWREAVFWIETLDSAIKAEIVVKKLVLCTALSILVFFLVGLVCKKLGLHKKIFSSVAMVIGAVLVFNGLWQLVGSPMVLFYENSTLYKNVAQNFNSVKPPAPNQNKNKISVLVYIGESTTVMNMGVYGYPRNTTPTLSTLAAQDSGLLVFKNVFSNHTHTTPSLLEALSFSELGQDKVVPIEQQKRLSLVDALVAADVPVWLFSNQGKSGTWNLGTAAVFRQARQQYSVRNSEKLGNAEDMQPRPFDADFFKSVDGPLKAIEAPGKKAVFFHSYTGHGPYAKYVPSDFSGQVDDLYSDRSKEGIAGRAEFSKQSLEEYDSAIRYVDYSIGRAIKSISDSSEPYVLVYFSDHGESVFTNRGHDSSRFLHEMMRVPLIVYFNAPAMKQYPMLFAKYKQLAQTAKPSTLAQLPATVLDLLGLDYSNSERRTIDITPVIGSNTSNSPILVRNTASGTEFVQITQKGSPQNNPRNIDKTDTATGAFRASQENGLTLCYHRTNTLAKAMRGLLATNCLEMDVVVEEDGRIDLYHPPQASTGYTLKDAIHLSQGKDKSLWLDSKNLENPAKCQVFDRFMAKQPIGKFKKILVEFPPGSHKSVGLKNCTQSLKNKGFAVSYYVPTEIGVECLNGVKSGQAFNNIKACVELKTDVEAAMRSGYFTDLSFDYAIEDAVERIGSSEKIKWNTWHVNESQLKGLNRGKYRMIILVNDDPNNI